MRPRLRRTSRRIIIPAAEIQEYTVDPGRTESEVPKYLTEAYLKANDLHTAAFKLAGSALPAGEQRNRVVEEERVVLDWLGKQFEVAKKLFAPYLDFRKIK